MALLKRHVPFALVTGLALTLGGLPLFHFINRTGQAEYYSHIPFIPVLGAFLLYKRRKILFKASIKAGPLAAATTAAGALIFLSGRILAIRLDLGVSLMVSGALIFWWGSYHLLYQRGVGLRDTFPLYFFACAVPLPVFMYEKLVGVLVSGSTFVTNLMFTAIGVPFLQAGSVFHLPGFSIEIANECSGIRSSIALFITAILAGYAFLDRISKFILLALSVVPIAILKNGIRIVTLYLLAYYIDIGFIDGGFLHRSGGFVFFGLGLVLLGGVIRALRD